MRMLRFIVFAYFLFLAGFFLTMPAHDLWSVLHGKPVDHVPFSPIAQDLVLIVLGAIFGFASLTAWLQNMPKPKPRKGWIAGASIVSLLLTVGVPALLYFHDGKIIFWTSDWVFALPTPIGIVGLFVFRHPCPQTDEAKATSPAAGA